MDGRSDGGRMELINVAFDARRWVRTRKRERDTDRDVVCFRRVRVGIPQVRCGSRGGCG